MARQADSYLPGIKCECIGEIIMFYAILFKQVYLCISIINMLTGRQRLE